MNGSPRDALTYRVVTDPLLQRLIPVLPSFIRRYKWFGKHPDDETMKSVSHVLTLTPRRHEA